MAEQLSLDLPEPKKKRGRPKKKPNYGRGQISQGPAKSGDMKIREKGTSKVKAARSGKFVISGRDALKYVPKRNKRPSINLRKEKKKKIYI